MPDFTFDAKAFFTVTVTADDERAARRIAQEQLDGAEANLGAWPDGTPILATLGLDGELDLMEVDGESA